MQPDVAKMGECEFRLISELKAQLIVHHPYRYLGHLQEHLELSQEATTIAWRIVNDHYLTDLPFRYPPHIIAVMAVVLTVTPGLHQSAAANSRRPDHLVSTGVLRPSSLPGGSREEVERLQQWLIQSDTIDVEAVMDAVQQMISLYVLLDQNPQSDEKCKEQIARFVGTRPDWSGGM